MGLMNILQADEVMSAMLPAIPRLLTALAEWTAIAAVLPLMNLRFHKAATALLMAAALPLQILTRCIYTEYHSTSAFAALMLVNIGVMLLCLWGMTRARLQDLIFSWLLAFQLAEFSASFLWQACCQLLEHPTMQEPVLLIILQLSLVIIDFGIVWMLRSLEGKIGLFDPTFPIMAAGITLLVFMTSNVYVLRESMWRSTGDGDLRSLISWVRTISDICGLILLWLLRFSKQRHLEREMERMERLMDVQYQQYLTFRESNEYIRRQYHDLKHQLTVFRSSRTSESQEAYLTEMEQMIRQYQTQCDVGNKVLDVFLTQKLRICEEKGIQLDYCVANAELLDQLETRDLCTLFGNLLDNAIEAVAPLSQEERIIQLDIRARNSFFSVRTENPCHAKLLFRDGIPITTKAGNRSAHGIGTQNIRYAVQKYDGNVEFEVRDGWFLCAILIPAE